MNSSPSAVPKPNVSDWLLDASVLLAYAYTEPGTERARAALDEGAAIGTVNLAEVVTNLRERGWVEAAIRDFVDRTSVSIVAFDREMAYDAGILRPATRHLGLSLGDRACLALARRLGAPVLTADRAWRDLDVGVEIEVVR
jgi:PIN domain nuclease of toxin-antitoxin system